MSSRLWQTIFIGFVLFNILCEQKLYAQTAKRLTPSQAMTALRINIGKLESGFSFEATRVEAIENIRKIATHYPDHKAFNDPRFYDLIHTHLQRNSKPLNDAIWKLTETIKNPELTKNVIFHEVQHSIRNHASLSQAKKIIHQKMKMYPSIHQKMMNTNGQTLSPNVKAVLNRHVYDTELGNFKKGLYKKTKDLDLFRSALNSAPGNYTAQTLSPLIENSDLLLEDIATNPDQYQLDKVKIDDIWQKIGGNDFAVNNGTATPRLNKFVESLAKSKKDKSLGYILGEKIGQKIIEEGFDSPFSKKVNGAAQSSYLNLLVRKPPNEVLKTLDKHGDKILAFANAPGHSNIKDSLMTYTESLRDKFPKTHKALDKFYQSLDKPGHANVSDAQICSAICTLRAKSSQWFSNAKFDIYRGSNSYNASVRALAAYFLLKSKDYCDSSGETLETADLVNYKHKYGEIVEPRKEAFQCSEENIHELAKEVINKTSPFLSITSPSESHMIYGKQFSLRLIDYYIDKEKNPRTLTALKARKAKLVKSMKKNLELRRKEVTEAERNKGQEAELELRRDKFKNSFLNHYAIASSELALKEDKSEAYDYMENIATRLKKENKELELPYADKSKPGTKEGAAGRNVPFYLALWRKADSPEKREQYKQSLVSAIKNYDENFVRLVSHTDRGSSKGYHLGRSGLAPYYFYSTLPYLTEAITELQADQSLDEHSQSYLKKFKPKLRDQIYNLRKGDGLFKTGTYTPDTKIYENPLAGWALLNLVNSCKP